jgi:hypothetical protein
MYVNCQYRVAAHFPSEPKFRDITYRDGSLSAPAREFYVEQDKARLSVTVVNFTNGPDKDKKLIDNAVAAFSQRGRSVSTTRSGTTSRISAGASFRSFSRTDACFEAAPTWPTTGFTLRKRLLI